MFKRKHYGSIVTDWPSIAKILAKRLTEIIDNSNSQIKCQQEIATIYEKAWKKELAENAEQRKIIYGLEAELKQLRTPKVRGERVGGIAINSRSLAYRVVKLRHSENLTLQEIAELLNSEGVSSARGGKWHASSVKALLESSQGRELQKTVIQPSFVVEQTKISKSLQRRNNHIERAKYFGVPWETNIEPFEVFAAFKWICQICSVEVDPRLPRGKYSASLDHIVPLSRGGGHLRSNVQLAHLVCNMRKGNRAQLVGSTPSPRLR
jgi:5-methylcytosine-specific restriction endonuclease McrA